MNRISSRSQITVGKAYRAASAKGFLMFQGQRSDMLSFTNRSFCVSVGSDCYLHGSTK